MRRYRRTVLTFLFAAISFARVYGQDDIVGLQVKTITGSVSYLDYPGASVNVKTDTGNMLFYISVQSELMRGTHHIASLEITKGDPVLVRYVNTTSGKNIIIKLEDNNPDPY